MSDSYRKFGGACGILAGATGLAYLVLFLLFKDPAALLPSLALLLTGLLASALIVALYYRLREVDEGFALWGLLLGSLGAAGAAIHAAFDLANNLNPPNAPFAYASPIDPRGFLTFAVAGLGAIVLAGLIVRGDVISRAVGYFGILSGILLIALYVTYMVTLNALNPLVLGLIVTSGLAQPIWYLWLGFELARSPAAQRERRPLAQKA